MDKTYDKFVEALEELIDAEDGSWRDKRDALKAAMEERDAMGKLEEVLAWFQE